MTRLLLRTKNLLMTTLRQLQAIKRLFSLRFDHFVKNTTREMECTNFVFFDLETAGLKTTQDILQISAICGDKKFNRYAKTRRCISEKTSKVNSLTLDKGVLKYRGLQVHAVNIRTALQKFVKFLEKIENPVLVAQNGKDFDIPFLRAKLKRFGLWRWFKRTVVGYVDTLEVFRDHYPERKSHKQVDLVADILGDDYEAHNATDDAFFLQKLCQSEKLIPSFLQHMNVFQTAST